MSFLAAVLGAEGVFISVEGAYFTPDRRVAADRSVATLFVGKTKSE